MLLETMTGKLCITFCYAFWFLTALCISKSAQRSHSCRIFMFFMYRDITAMDYHQQSLRYHRSYHQHFGHMSWLHPVPYVQKRRSEMNVFYFTSILPPINSLIRELFTIQLSSGISLKNFRKSSILCASQYTSLSEGISSSNGFAYFFNTDNS